MRILVASDGSASALAALRTATAFPWPLESEARVVVARATPLLSDSVAAASYSRAFDFVAEEAVAALRARWPRAEANVVDEEPAEAIVVEAERIGAATIVLGWRGHGTFRRLLPGSVSRAVAARARCPVIVVRSAPRRVRRILLAYDGSANAKRALEYLLRLVPPPRGRVRLVQVVHPVIVPASVGRFPRSLQLALRGQAAQANKEQVDAAKQELDKARDDLRTTGWVADASTELGAPAATLLSIARAYPADVIVAGACGRGTVERVFLGSVANALLERSPVPVVLVR